MKRPEGKDLQRFLVPECVFSFGNCSSDEEEKTRAGDVYMRRAVDISADGNIVSRCPSKPEETKK